MGRRRAYVRRAALGALVLAGCLPTLADRVAEVRAKLIGLKARELSGCVGVPYNVEEDGETEFLTYRWFDQEESDPFAEPIGRGPRLPGQETDVLGSDRPAGRDPAGRDPAGRDERKADRPPAGVAYCELVFEVREGRVQSVEVEGRRASGLNNDAECIQKAERCTRPRSGP